MAANYDNALIGQSSPTQHAPLINRMIAKTSPHDLAWSKNGLVSIIKEGNLILESSLGSRNYLTNAWSLWLERIANYKIYKDIFFDI